MFNSKKKPGINQVHLDSEKSVKSNQTNKSRKSVKSQKQQRPVPFEFRS